MLEKIVNKIGTGLVIVSLSTLVSCTSVASGLASSMVGGMASGFSQHVGRRVGEALLGAEQLRIIGADGKETVKTVPKSGYNALNDPDIKDIRLSTDREQGVFSVNFGGQYEIFRVNKDGSNLERLTFTQNRNEYLPTFSPDGKKVGFIILGKDYSKSSGLYIMNFKDYKKNQIMCFKENSIGDPYFYTKKYGGELLKGYLGEYGDAAKYFKIEWNDNETFSLYFNYHQGCGWERVTSYKQR